MVTKFSDKSSYLGLAKMTHQPKGLEISDKGREDIAKNVNKGTKIGNYIKF